MKQIITLIAVLSFGVLSGQTTDIADVNIEQDSLDNEINEDLSFKDDDKIIYLAFTSFICWPF